MRSHVPSARRTTLSLRFSLVSSANQGNKIVIQIVKITNCKKYSTHTDYEDTVRYDDDICARS